MSLFIKSEFVDGFNIRIGMVGIHSVTLLSAVLDFIIH